MSDMTKPGVQKPHCEPWCSTNAACTGCRLAAATPRVTSAGDRPIPAAPSTVSTWWSAMAPNGVMQLLRLKKGPGAPSLVGSAKSCTITVQAPQSPDAQPSLVPVSPGWARMCSKRLTLGSKSKIGRSRPFIHSRIIGAV